MKARGQLKIEGATRTEPEKLVASSVSTEDNMYENHAVGVLNDLTIFDPSPCLGFRSPGEEIFEVGQDWQCEQELPDPRIILPPPAGGMLKEQMVLQYAFFSVKGLALLVSK